MRRAKIKKRKYNFERRLQQEASGTTTNNSFDSWRDAQAHFSVSSCGFIFFGLGFLTLQNVEAVILACWNYQSGNEINARLAEQQQEHLRERSPL